MENSLNGTSDKKQILSPIKLLAFSQQFNFCHVINESMIVYMAGGNLLLENIRNHQQMMIWTNQLDLQIQTIFKYRTYSGQVYIGIILKNATKHSLKIFEIDWNSYFHKQNKPRNFNFLHVDIQNTILMAKFDKKGQNIALIQKHYTLFFLTFYCLSENKVISSLRLEFLPLDIKSFQICGEQYIVLIHHHSVYFYQLTCKYFQQKQKTDGLTLDPGQSILQVEFQENQRDQIIMIVLTSAGNFKIGCLRENVFERFLTLDFRLRSPEGENRLYYPSAFTSYGNKVVFGYKGCRKISYITYSLLNYSQYTITTSEDVLFYSESERDLDKNDQNQLREVTVCKISSSSDNCIYAFIVSDAQNSHSLMIVDTLQSLTNPQSIVNPSQRVFGNDALLGRCYAVSHLELQGSFFVLYQNFTGKCKLAYFSIDHSCLQKLTPNSIIQWDEELKAKASDILVHPQNRTIFFIQEETVKVHFYSRQKIFECHSVLNISNCFCGSFNYLYDKLFLASPSGVYIIDITLCEVTTFVSNAAYLHKIPKKFVKISESRMGLEVANSCSSVIYEISDFGQISQLGSIQVQASDSQNEVKRASSNNEVIAIDHERNIIAVAEISSGICFYSKKMEEINKIQSSVSCMELYKQIDILLLGMMNGFIYICRWPQIVNTTASLQPDHFDVIGAINIHSSQVISLKFTSNYRYIFSISQNGQICVSQFYHENSTVISRQASLHMLKKSNVKPYCNFTMTSREVEDKRVQTIIKTIGKQAKQSAKNEQICKQLRENLKDRIKLLKQRSSMQLKEQLQTCPQQIKVRELMRKIQITKGMIIDLKFKTEKEMPAIEEAYTEEIQKIFKEKNQLEKTIESLVQKFNNNLNTQKKQENQEKEQDNLVFQTQINLINEGLYQNVSMYDKYQKVNRGLYLNIEADKEDDRIMINNLLERQLKSLNNHKNEMTAKIRKMTFEISELLEKQKAFGLRTLEIESNLQIIRQFVPDIKGIKSLVSNQLKQAQNTSKKLMDEERMQELKKQQSQIKGLHSQNYFSELQKQYGQLVKTYKELESHEFELEDEFFQENKKRIDYTKWIDESKQKIEELKKKRNLIKRQANIKSNKTKMLKSKQWVETPQEKTPVKSKQNCLLESKIQEREKLCEKIDRMNTIKNEKIKKCIIINEKLISDNNKLTSQLNQLRRYNEFLSKKEKKLKIQLSRGSLSIKNDSSKKASVSIFTPVHQSFSQTPKYFSRKQQQTKQIPLKRGFFSLHNQNPNGKEKVKT